MKECLKETKMVAYFLDPILLGEKDPLQLFSTARESCLVKALSHNKVVMSFGKKLGLDDARKEKIFNTFPRVKELCDNISLKSEKDSSAFSGIKREFSENDVEFILIKSDGSFPYESDNLDVLIKPYMLGEVSRLLKEAGYTELPEVRERHKYLFRNTCMPDVLPLHIHTKVEWEGTQFLDSTCLWSRRIISPDNRGFSAPSPEDCILITSAHLFFENHEIKLADLFKITSKLRNHPIDWEYILNHARKLRWDDAFCLTMLFANRVHEALCGRSMLQRDVLFNVRKANHGYPNLFQKTMKPFSSECTPLSVPYSVAILFFINRILRESKLSLTGRLKRIDQVAANVLRERIIRSEKLVKSLSFR